MAIADRIEEAVAKMKLGDYVNALYQVFPAVDTTAKKEGLIGRPGTRIKEFFRKNQDFLLVFELLGGGREIILPLTNRAGKTETKTFEEILYKLVRNALFHDSGLPDQIISVSGFGLAVSGDGKLSLSPGLIWGMIYAVIGSPANSNEHSHSSVQLTFFEDTFPLNELWGKRARVLALAQSQIMRGIPQRGRRTPDQGRERS